MGFLGRQNLCEACGTVEFGKCDDKLGCNLNSCRSCRKIAARVNFEIEYCEKEHYKLNGTAKDMNRVVESELIPSITPHLDVTCKKCGYTWLEKCDDIERD